MRAPKVDQTSQRDIDRLVLRVLRDAGFRGPPVDIGQVLDTLKLDREFYDLESPRLMQRIRHGILVGKKRLSEFVERVSLQAIILFDDNRVLLDQALPPRKHDWALAHEAGHELIPWHRSLSRGDTQQTLDPFWHEQLEAEANYAASGLLFCGKVFTTDAMDTTPCWQSVEDLKRRYKKNLLPTARRYVERGPEHGMALLVSTAAWDHKPRDQATRVRHMVLSPTFESRFMEPEPDLLRKKIDAYTQRRRGGPVGDFECTLPDRNGEMHLFRVECFYNRYYVISLFVHRGPAAASVVTTIRAASA